MSYDHAREDWYVVAYPAHMADAVTRETMLLGTGLTVSGPPDAPKVHLASGEARPALIRYNHVWTTLSDTPRPLFEIDEAAETDRRFVPCGSVRVAASPLRVVENFLDIAHFPYVHTGILGAEPHTEVAPYKVEIRDAVDEVWATQISFFQPQAAKSADGGITTRYEYRVPAPMSAILYKTCPPKPEAMDVIAIFVQPLGEELCDVWPWMALYDEVSPLQDLIQFQQEIFLQDRSILENQIPRRLPLDPKMEIPTKSDLTSVAYRRWLKRKGALYGAVAEAI